MLRQHPFVSVFVSSLSKVNQQVPKARWKAAVVSIHFSFFGGIDVDCAWKKKKWHFGNLKVVVRLL